MPGTTLLHFYWKLVLQESSNCIRWSPTEAYTCKNTHSWEGHPMKDVSGHSMVQNYMYKALVENLSTLAACTKQIARHSLTTAKHPSKTTPKIVLNKYLFNGGVIITYSIPEELLATNPKDHQAYTMAQVPIFQVWKLWMQEAERGTKKQKDMVTICRQNYKASGGGSIGLCITKKEGPEFLEVVPLSAENKPFFANAEQGWVIDKEGLDLLVPPPYMQ
ncbi:uncharacterized protein EDB91DRAFT_1088193 [Suillus paluster]|uniref:uncharacterized protein n=1 Tax=Suillus paluster TaxID=48578 RepID=UPI001B87DA8B|nr:uncharacterized protein EDB91DRAFT_1088193 [Suillus paluster]KAG1722285.1 hypothetical protein EDB91DRAFT_1088193 [Suillus paluster]